MQIIQSKSSFVEKIFRDKNGRLVRAEFCVYENGGRIKARLVNFKYLDEPILIKCQGLSLTGNISTKNSASQISYKKSYVSPFVQGSTLYFLGSKPRAPTFALVP